MTDIRDAHPSDAPGMARLLNKIIEIGGTTAHRAPLSAEAVLKKFIAPPLKATCFAAVRGEAVVGFQALEWADPSWPGAEALPADWAIISTYVDASVHGEGVGRALFRATRNAARMIGIRYIDATIRLENAGGLAFYQAMGFRDYRRWPESRCTRLAP